jgi:WD40 repeat protein
LLLLAFLDFGVAHAQETTLKEIPDEDAPILELKPLHRLKLSQSSHEFCFSSDGKIFAAKDGVVVRIWNTERGKEIGCLSTGDKEYIHSIAISPNGREVAFATGKESRIEVFDVTTGKLIRTLSSRETNTTCIYRLQFTPDGKGIIFSDLTTSLRKWDLESGKADVLYKENIDAGGGMAVSSDGKLLAVAPDLKSVHLFDMATGKLLLRVPEEWKGDSSYVAFSPGGRLLATDRWGGGNSVKVWDAHSGEVAWELSWPLSLDPKSDPLSPNRQRKTGATGTVFSADGRTLRVAGYDGFDRLWETATRKLRYRVHHDGLVILSVARSGSYFASENIMAPAPEIVLYDTRTCLPALRLSTPPDLDKLWSGLASDDAATAYENMRMMAGVPKEATALLENRLSPVARVSHTEIQKLIADLDEDDFDIRDKARKRLTELSDPTEPALTKALTRKPSVESARTIKNLLSVFSGPARGDRVRVIRAVEVLETLATPEARKLLKSWSGGEPTALLTREAKAALERLDRE